MQVSRPDSSFENRICGGDTLLQICVTNIETEIHLQMRQLKKGGEALGARKLIWYVLQQYLYSTLARKKIDFLKRGERCFHLVLVVFFSGDPDMLYEVTERNHLRDIDGAFDLVDHEKTLRFHRLRNIDVRVRP